MQNKLKRLSALLLAVMVIVLAVPIMPKASDSVYYDIYENCYDNINGHSDNVVIQNFINNGCFLRRSESDSEKGIYISLDTRDWFNVALNSLSNDYKYIYFACGYNGGASAQFFVSNKLFYGFNGGIVVPDATDLSDIKCLYYYMGNNNSINRSHTFSGDYSNIDNWTEGVKNYYDQTTTTYNGQSFVIVNAYSSCNSGLLYATVPVYSTYEANSLVYGESMTSDYTSSLNLASTDFKGKFDKFWGKLTNVNVFSTGYTGADYEGGGSLDESLGLTQFTLHPVYDNRYVSNFGLSFQYAFNEDAQTLLSDGGKLNVEYTIQCRYKETNSNYVSPLITLTNQQLYDIRSDNCETVSLESLLLKANIKSGATSDNDIYTITSLLQVLSGVSVESWELTTKTSGSSIGAGGSLGLSRKTLIPGITFSYNKTDSTTSTSTVNTYEFTTFTVTAYAVGTNGVYHTNRRTSSVDLVQGTNTHYNNIGDDTGGYYPDTSDYVSNSNYFTYDNDSNTYNYYNSVTNETKSVGESPTVTMGDIIVNVDVSGGGGGSMIQNNNVTFPDSIKIFIESHLPDSEPNVTIEDDDLTDVSLRDDLADGFGFLDDASTPEKNDGYIAMVSDFYSGIDPHFKDLIMFGVSTTIGVAILRMIFKR